MNYFGRHLLSHFVHGSKSVGIDARQLLPSYDHILTTPLYGSIGDEAYYYLNIFIGNPPQKQSVILDTGSSIFGFPCKGCVSCGTHVNELFDFNSSTTSHWVDCSDKECFSNKCSIDKFGENHHHCEYYQAYSEGSSISGKYFSDLISLTALQDGKDHQSRGISYDTQLTTRYDQIGCHEIETRLFVGQIANGIIGVAFHRSHQPSAMDALFTSSPRWNGGEHSSKENPQKIFSICISDKGGIMTMGGVDPNYLVTENPKEVATTQNDGVKVRQLWNIGEFFEEPDHKMSYRDYGLLETKIVSESGYNIGAEKMYSKRSGEDHKTLIQGNFGESTIVDSGTTYTYFPPKLYSSLFTYFSDICNEMSQCTSNTKSGLSEICYFPSAEDSEDHKDVLNELDHIFPTLYITLKDGVEIPWFPRSYMYFNSGIKDSWCLAMDNNHVNETVLGMNFIKNRMAIFDRENHQLGLLKGDCPIMTDATRDSQKGPDLSSLETDENNDNNDDDNLKKSNDNENIEQIQYQYQFGDGIDKPMLYRYVKLKLDDHQ